MTESALILELDNVTLPCLSRLRGLLAINWEDDVAVEYPSCQHRFGLYLFQFLSYADEATWCRL